MHAHRRQIPLSLATMSTVAVLILGFAATTPLAAQEPGQGIPRTGVKAAAVQPKRPAAPADKGVRKAAQEPANAVPPREKVDLVAAKAMDDLLQKWEIKSAKIKTLSVKYKRKDVSRLFNTEKVYEGEARLTSDNRAYLDFWEIVQGQAKPVFDERIICDGKDVYQFKGATRQIFVFPLPADQRQKAIQQGPLPFLFNMRAAEAKKRYHMTLAGEDAESYTIKIIPLLPIDREEYSQALIKLSKNPEDPSRDLLPQAIRLTSPEGKDTKTFTFSAEGMIPNKPIGDNWFDGAKMTAGLSRLPKRADGTEQRWAVIHNPGADGQPQGAAPAPAVGARPAPANGGRPAMKGQAGGIRQK